MSADGTDDVADDLGFVRAEIIHDDDVASFEGWRQNLLDIGLEAFAVDRPVEHEWRGNPVVPERGEEGHGLPVAMRHLGIQRFATALPAVGPGHVGLRPGLIDEDQAVRADPRLIFLPPGPPPGDVWPVLLGGVNGFF